MAYNCDFEDGNAAAVLITMLDGSASFAACGHHVGLLFGQIATATGVEIPHPGVVKLEDLAAIGEAREKEIDTIKGTGPVLRGRKDELEWVLMEVAKLIAVPDAHERDAQADPELQPAVVNPGSDSGDASADYVATNPDVPFAEARVDADDPAPY